MSAARATLIYDGSCGFCRRWVERVRRWDRGGRLEMVPYQAADLESRFPGVSRADCVERITRHPFFMGFALAALAHVPLATRLVGAVFQAGLAALAIVGAWHQDRKLAALRGRPYDDYVAQTSAVPFGAILAGRQRLVWRELPYAALALCLAAAVWLRAVHGAIFDHGGAWLVGVVLGGAAAVGLVSWRRARRARGLRASARWAGTPAA